ncbi:Trimethyllysine dioxygenase, partial [Eremomyces bilateralis CBS 781.70]
IRDHCRCPTCFHPETKQRLIETFLELPEDIHILDVREEGDLVQIVSDGHTSQYPRDWLAASALKGKTRAVGRQGTTDETDFKQTPVEVEYAKVMESDEGVGEWLLLIRKYGFAYVNGCPATPEATEKLLERISYIRNTHYGAFWDFTANMAAKDTAYTTLAIGSHTDTTYFSDPCGLQMFHLLSHTGGQGGKSLLSDGFATAKALRDEDPQAYKILSEVPVHSHASGNEGLSIQPFQTYPVLNHDTQSGELIQVRWNTTDRAAIDLPLEDMDLWYKAARKWARQLEHHHYWEQLRPERPLIFDNWRVLHGRSNFTGKRRLCGGYINHDDFISRFKMTNFGETKVLEQVSLG